MTVSGAHLMWMIPMQYMTCWNELLIREGISHQHICRKEPGMPQWLAFHEKQQTLNMFEINTSIDFNTSTQLQVFINWSNLPPTVATVISKVCSLMICWHTDDSNSLVVDDWEVVPMKRTTVGDFSLHHPGITWSSFAMKVVFPLPGVPYITNGNLQFY